MINVSILIESFKLFNGKEGEEEKPRTLAFI